MAAMSHEDKAFRRQKKIQSYYPSDILGGQYVYALLDAKPEAS